MKKTNIFFIAISLCCSSLFSQQIVTLDQTPQVDWPNSPYLNDLVIYDNDILYNINRTTSGFNPEVLLNYGEPNSSINIHPNQNHALRLKMDVPNRLFRQFYDGGYYNAGTEIFGQAFANANNTNTNVYELNKSRTMFLPNNYGLKSLEKIDHNTIVGRDTIFDTPNSYYAIKMVQPNVQKTIKLHEAFFKNEGTYGGMFLYNNTLHYQGSLVGKLELYADNGFGESKRITYLSSGYGTGPQYLTPTNDGIWFSGKNIISTDTGSTKDEGWDLCYTNGSPDLNAPPAKGFGYTPVQINTTVPNGPYYISNPVIFGRVNGKIIYYEQTTSVRKMFAYSANNTELLNVPDFVFQDNGSLSFGILNDKLYLITGFETGPFMPKQAKIIEIDGTPEGTKVIDLPIQTPGATNFMVFKNAIYFTVNNKFFKFNPNTASFQMVFETEGYLISNVTPYQNGFVFLERDNQYAPYSVKLKGWNIEKRQVIHDPSNTNKQNTKNNQSTNYKLYYNAKEYNLNIHNSTFVNADKLKIQLLDTENAQMQQIIGNIPENSGEIKSKLFYAINTFTNDNTHTSEISFGYDETMFGDITNFDPANLKLHVFQNGTTKTITTNLNLADKTLKVSTNFEDESYVYFSYTGTLSINDDTPESHFNVYPNPATSKFTISTTNNSIQKVEVYNLLGKKVTEIKTANKNKVEISTQQFSKGMYLIKIVSDNKIELKKILLN